MSAFAELEQLVSDEIDAHFGDTVRVEPKAASKYFAGQADGARASRTVTAVVDVNPVTLIAQDTGKYDGSRPALAADKIHVSFDERNFVDWMPKQNDVIVWLESVSPEVVKDRFVVSRTDPDGLGRFVAVCTRAAEDDDP